MDLRSGSGAGGRSEAAARAVEPREWRGVVFFGLAATGILVGASVWLVVGPGSEFGGWGSVLLAGLPLSLAALLVVAVHLARRRGLPGYRLVTTSPLDELTSPRQRAALVTAIRRGTPIPAGQHDLAVRVARDISQRTGQLWLWSALAAGQVANAFVHDGWSRILFAVSSMLFLGVVGYGLWSVALMRRRLSRLEAGSQR